MPRNYSNAWKETTNSTGAAEAPLLMLEIEHVDLAEPIRVVNDAQDLVHNGDTFVALAFGATLPDDLEQGEPRAVLTVDNVGRELTEWLELSGGGRGATVRMIQVLRSAPDVVEWEVTMDLNDVRVNLADVSGTLTFDSLINLPGIALTYRPDVAPGIF